MKALVTGGAGFIASHLLDRLASDKSLEIAVIDDFSAGRIENIAPLIESERIELVKADIRDFEIVDDIMSNSDVVFHLAAKTNVDESLVYPSVFDEVNSKGTLNMLRAARKHNARFLHISTSEVYGTAKYAPIDENHPLEPASPYAASKVAAERYAYSFYVSYGLPVVILRLFNNYGPRQKGNVLYGGLIACNVIRSLCGVPLIIRGGSQTRDYLYVKDTVDALIAASNSRRCIGEVINIGSGRDYSVSEIVRMIARTGEKEVPVSEGRARPGDVQRLLCDFSKARKILDWTPRYDLAQGLSETIGWYSDHLEEFRRYIFPSFAHGRGAEPLQS